MTKVQVHFDLTRPLDAATLARLADAPKLFGLTRVQVDPASQSLIVDYDAARLTLAQVDAALHRAGIPARRAAVRS